MNKAPNADIKAHASEPAAVNTLLEAVGILLSDFKLTFIPAAIPWAT